MAFFVFLYRVTFISNLPNFVALWKSIIVEGSERAKNDGKNDDTNCLQFFELDASNILRTCWIEVSLLIQLWSRRIYP